MVSPAGIEPAAYSLGGYRSIQLSYEDGYGLSPCRSRLWEPHIRHPSLAEHCFIRENGREGKTESPSRPTICRPPECLPATGAARATRARPVLRLVPHRVPRIAACGIMAAASAPCSRLVSQRAPRIACSVSSLFRARAPLTLTHTPHSALYCLCFQTGVSSRFPIYTQK